MSRFGRAAKAVDFIPTNAGGSIMSRLDWEHTASTGQTFGGDAALNLSAVWRGVNLLANTVAMLPLITYERLGGDGRARAPGHHLYRLLHRRPNPMMSSFQWRQTLMGHVVTRGNHFSERQVDGAGRAIAYWPLRPDRMVVERERSASPVPRLQYRYRLPDGSEVVLPASRVLHIRGLGYDGVIGYSPITLMRETLGIASAAQKAQGNSFRNGARPGLVLVHPKTLDVEARGNLRASLKQFEGFTNAQRTMILEEDIKPTTIGFSPEDAQYLQTRKFEVVEFARWIGVPPHKLYELERSTNNNIEHQSLEFLGDSLDPWLVNIEQQIMLDELPDDETYFVEFLRDAVMRTDSRARGEYYRTLWNLGAINADTIVARENLPAIPDGLGSKYYGPLNVAPLDQLADMTLEQRAAVFGALRRGGVTAESAEEIAGLPDMDHTGLEPVTVSEQTGSATNGRSNDG